MLGAVGTVAAKNPIRGRWASSDDPRHRGLFLALRAQFLAAIQLIVYAGAIVVLFLFVIMSSAPAASTPSAIIAGASRARSAPVSFAAVASARPPRRPRRRKSALSTSGRKDFGGVDASGRIIFTGGAPAVRALERSPHGRDRRRCRRVGAGHKPDGPLNHESPQEALADARGSRPRRPPRGALETRKIVIPAEYHYVAPPGAPLPVGGAGFLVRRNVLVTLMSIEIMLNAVNLALVAFNRRHGRRQITPARCSPFIIIAAEAAEGGRRPSRSSSRSSASVAPRGSDDADLLKNWAMNHD